jgi:hypothetical protein
MMAQEACNVGRREKAGKNTSNNPDRHMAAEIDARNVIGHK